MLASSSLVVPDGTPSPDSHARRGVDVRAVSSRDAVNLHGVSHASLGDGAPEGCDAAGVLCRKRENLQGDANSKLCGVLQAPDWMRALALDGAPSFDAGV